MKALRAVGHFNLTFLVRSCPLPRILNKPTLIQSHRPGRRMLSHFPDGIPLNLTGQIPWEGIHRSRLDTWLKKPDLPWGISIYRCTYKDNKAWERVLQQIQGAVQKSLEKDARHAPKLIPHH